MRWLYHLQHRIGLTRQECMALLFIVLAMLVGLLFRTLHRPGPPEVVEIPAAHDERFAASARQFRAGAPATAPVEVPAVRPKEQAPPPAPSSRLDLNRATAPQLERLPRIGPKIAARIIAYREAHGPFARLTDLTRVRGIGEKTLARLEPYLFVDEGSPPPSCPGC